MNTTSSASNQNTILGVNTTYDSMLVVEGIILSHPAMQKLRNIGKLNKTSLMKMALMEFLRTPVSDAKLKRLFTASVNDDKFRAVISGGQLN
jgi:hypothetical protein|tara:strand:+ start:731 stop:1006 length:276 start_codon:yes stop_codon:yes gene_type:complete